MKQNMFVSIVGYGKHLSPPPWDNGVSVYVFINYKIL